MSNVNLQVRVNNAVCSSVMDTISTKTMNQIGASARCLAVELCEDQVQRAIWMEVAMPLVFGMRDVAK